MGLYDRPAPSPYRFRMENRGLLFIPDISGFTRFVSETGIEHSRLIIQELLEILISANRLGLEISEIEGDAILFYKFGSPPDLEELYGQVEEMFCAFHRSLLAYEQRRYCQCEACNAAVNLSLKVITHFGEFTGYKVRDFNKLIGKDVIVAHQLLKNDIDSREYWLVTKGSFEDGPSEGLAAMREWASSAKRTETGDVPFRYTILSELKNRIEPEMTPHLGLESKAKVLTVSREYDTDIITLFHASGDFQHRPRWRHGVKEVMELGHFLPRVGMRCRCVMENGEEHVVHASGYTWGEERIEFSETDGEKRAATYYTLERTGRKRTRLTLDYYVPDDMITKVWFRFSEQKRIEADLDRSMQNLVRLVGELKIPSALDS
jgi:hypothetical protein